MPFIGYAPASTGEQSIKLEIDVLRHTGFAQIFEDDGVSAMQRDRLGLDSPISRPVIRRWFGKWTARFAPCGDCLAENIDRCMYHARNAFSE